MKISDTEGNFSMETKVNKVEKPCLLELPNPHYDNLIKKYVVPWKGNHPLLPSNKRGSIQRLESPMQKLNRMSNTCTEEYKKIIEDQIQENIVEIAPEQPNEREIYTPH